MKLNLMFSHPQNEKVQQVQYVFLRQGNNERI